MEDGAYYQSDKYYEPFRDMSDRNGFIRKVYGILSVELIWTSLFVLLPVLSDDVRLFMRAQIWLYIMAAICMIVLMIVLMCVRSLSRSVPTNYILLFLFTSSFAYCVAAITAFYPPLIVLAAALMTAAIVVALTIYAFTTKTDFTYMGGCLMFMGLGLMFACLMLFLWNIPALTTSICVLLILLYGLYLIYDT